MTKKYRLTDLRAAFSLVEVLAAVTVIGVVTFLAIPNIVRVKKDSEDSLARARADALNVAAAAYFQARGSEAANAWDGANSEDRYALLQPWLSFAPTTLDEYMPGGYSIIFDPEPHRNKASLLGPDSTEPMQY